MGRMVKGGRRPRVTRAPKGAFNDARREAFLAELAATCNVTLACACAKVSSTSVYRERQKNAAFRAGWARALEEGYARLELMMLERAMNGTVKEVRRADGSVERVTDYSDRVALQLLRMHKDNVEETAAEPDEEEVEEARERVLKKLEAVRKRMDARGA